LPADSSGRWVILAHCQAVCTTEEAAQKPVDAMLPLYLTVSWLSVFDACPNANSCVLISIISFLDPIIVSYITTLFARLIYISARWPCSW
jgi:hypothetical protein